MAVALEGTPDTTAASGSTYTVESASDRVCIWVIGSRESGGPADVTSPLLGAVAMNVRAQRQTVSTNNHNISINDVLEAAIPGGSQTLSATISGSNNGAAFTLSGVNQDTPLDTSVADGSGSPAATPSFDVQNGGIAIIAVQAQGGITGTPAGYTLIADNIITGTAEISVAYKLITGDGTETPSWTTGSGVWVVAAVSYAPVAAGGSVGIQVFQGPSLNSFIR